MPRYVDLLQLPELKDLGWGEWQVGSQLIGYLIRSSWDTPKPWNFLLHRKRLCVSVSMYVCMYVRMYACSDFIDVRRLGFVMDAHSALCHR